MPKIPASANQCLFTDARRQQMFDAFGCSQTGRRLANAETSGNLAVGGCSADGSSVDLGRSQSVLARPSCRHVGLIAASSNRARSQLRRWVRSGRTWRIASARVSSPDRGRRRA